MEKKIYNLNVQEALEKFNSSFSGLSAEESKKRLKEFGQNKIEKKERWKILKMILAQFNEAMVWILLVAGSLALVFGEFRDASIIFIIILINAVIGFLQEFKAERVLEKIKKLTADETIVIRSGEKNEISAKEIVPGDVIFVSEGDSVPSDGYIIESFGLRVNSFIFTGEAAPKSKSEKVYENNDMIISDIENMLFMGETIAAGEAKFMTTSTGMKTELGKIAGLTQEMKEGLTPMQKKMRELGRNITVLAVCIGTLVMIAGQYFHMSLYHNFLFALALAVSVVPEGLPAAISVALSLGMKRLLKKNVLAKRLNAVETLGSVSIICTDKTGTITKNELTVTKLFVDNKIIEVSGSGYFPEGKFFKEGHELEEDEKEGLEMIFRIGALCNDASLIKEENQYKIIGDPTEGAIIVASKKFNDSDGYFEKGKQKIFENPFSSERRMMSVIFKNSEKISYVKGSPDTILNLCSKILINGKAEKFSEEQKNIIKEAYDGFSSQALRVLAFAYRNLDRISEDKYQDESEKELVWAGMMAMIDPPRQDVKEAIGQCRKLGVEVIMITGDYEITAKAIAEKAGLLNGNNDLIITGKELEFISDEELYKKIKNKNIVFARVSPEQKLRIAKVLKNKGEIIAMTGDGVNDAPALKKADIGVAMGIMGTDVSKEASDMILLDDNFASIVKGILEGRTIYQNMKKFVHYVLTSNASELFTVVFGVILQIPSPITAIQILATDLGTDVLPSFSLSLEPAEPDTIGKRRKKQGIITFQGFRRIIYLGIIMAIGASVAFVWSMIRGGWYFGEDIVKESSLYLKSTTAAYAVISMTQMANLLQSRSEKFSPFTLGFFKNKYVIGAIFISIGILLCFMYVPACQKYLQMSPIDWIDWIVVIVTSLAVFLWEEARKAEGK